MFAAHAVRWRYHAATLPNRVKTSLNTVENLLTAASTPTWALVALCVIVRQ
jgi:hypothetical protein